MQLQRSWWSNAWSFLLQLKRFMLLMDFYGRKGYDFIFALKFIFGLKTIIRTLYRKRKYTIVHCTFTFDMDFIIYTLEWNLWITLPLKWFDEKNLIHKFWSQVYMKSDSVNNEPFAWSSRVANINAKTCKWWLFLGHQESI